MKTKIGLPLGLALVMFIGIFTTMLALGALNPQRASAITTVTVTLASSDGGTSTGNVDIRATTAVTFSAQDSNLVSNTLTISLPLIFDVTEEDKIEDASKWVLGGTAPSSVELTVGAAGVGSADDTPHTILLTTGSGMSEIAVTPPAVGTIPVDYRPDANTGLKLAIEGATGVTISVEVSTEPDLPGTSAEFDIDPAPAVDGGFSVNVGYSLPGEVSSYSFPVTAEEEFGADDTLTITFPVGTGLGAMSVGTADNWTLGGSVPQTVTVTVSERMVELKAPSSNFGTITTGNDIVVEALESAGIVNPPAGTGLTFSVTTNEAPNAGVSVGFNITHDPTVNDVTVTQDPTDPGAGARYQIIFTTAYGLSEGTDEIILNIDQNFGVPSSLSNQDVRISADGVAGTTGSTANQSRPLDDAPRYRVLPGTDNRKEYRISIPDMDASPDRNASIAADATVTLTLQANAGFTNPTEASTEDIRVSTSRQTTEVGADVVTPVLLFSDDIADNRNKPLTVTGKGFKNGTTATVYLDKNQNGIKDSGDTDLVSVPVGSDDTFEATFNVTVPPFEALPKKNVINAVDGEAPPNTVEWILPTDDPTADDYEGRTNNAKMAGAPTFEVEGLITVSPNTVGIGDTLTIDLKDWPNEQITELKIGDVNHLPTSPLTVTNNVLQFDIQVKNGVGLGTQQVEIASGDERDNTNVLISGADLIVTPSAAVPNQTVNVTGRGFSNGATINHPGDTSSVTFDGNAQLLKTAGIYDTAGTLTNPEESAASRRINGGKRLDVDNGGNWSASIVIPVTSGTTTPGPHELKIKDSGGREGVVIITLTERSITLDPPASRVGTMVTATGHGYPGRNSSEGAAGVQVVQIQYNELGTFRTVASVTPDSSGSFTTTFRVPLNAGIPSTNSVRATFNYDDSATGVSTGDIPTSATHEVPEGTISLSQTEATPGDNITVSGEGFKAYTSVTSVFVGDIEVTPSPKPNTGETGSFTATFLMPQADLGIKNIEVKVGNTTASASLNVVEESTEPMMPGMMPGEAMAPAMAFAAAIAEDNLITVYHFDPATQSEAPNFGWTLYDARPLFMGGNNLDMVNPGGFYFVEVSENQMGVTLGGRTMDLYAGLNPIVW